LDGTLIHHKDEKNIIYDDVIEQLHKSIEGKHFSIATGRHYKDVLSIVEKHNILMPKNSYIVGANGCQIYSVDNKNLILNMTLEEEIVQNDIPKLVEYLDETLPNGTMMFAYGKDEIIYFVKNKSKNFDNMVKAVLAHEDNDGVFKYLVVNTFEELKDITKFCVDFFEEIEDPLKLMKGMGEISSNVDFANTGPNFIEIIIKDINKATALKFINDNHYKLDTKEIVVFGDSGNDVEMMDYAGTSVTRHDARPEIIERATLVFPGGASKFVKNGLIELIK
jgi:hypothetical protein